MPTRTARYAATDEALLAYALAPTMRWLIATALDKTKMTYGDVKRRLETEEGFSTIFATRIGLVAGELMNLIHSIDPKAPLINVLVVNQQDELPSKGAGSFMATRFKNPRLSIKNYKQLYPAKWRTYFDRAAAEVYAYSREAWAELYEAVFDERLPQEAIEAEREKRQEGNEDDFGTGAGKYGAGGEGVHHRALRLWVTNNPDKVGRGYPRARTETEYNLDSGDRVDSVFHLADRTIALEVKSRISNFVDLKRGVFQCIKYRAVMTAMDVRTEVPVEAVLVTETKLPGEILALLRLHGIRHFQAPLERLA